MTTYLFKSIWAPGMLSGPCMKPIERFGLLATQLAFTALYPHAGPYPGHCRPPSTGAGQVSLAPLASTWQPVHLAVYFQKFRLHTSFLFCFGFSIFQIRKLFSYSCNMLQVTVLI
ncbi:uncharacterized protein PGTG_15052 [Puccinia graminis f. sp. tritici CRL 75-36-700-3]|uniref:Uncharacterized protein n=1 Tax=Puccinia graminis f. sp. tritici (strain CRL 75-36-700-3 / race SCCL) TaxID=418459 RepID=E3KY10_PUCGT|nr:uncharacterized protein PGTG_15052 [Puccinia graminis f. sp. tritici CRL 75-36-700-3]EFP89211.1 hypothetical protein PGTG_15052 [Puccinia graminis f. sp. tritici CRL 75-36-700-3]